MGHGAAGFAVLALAAALLGCGEQRQAEATSAAATPTSAPPAAFAPCRTCHSLEAGRTIIGPSLHGVVGRRAGRAAGFAYSNALKASGLTWNAATLDTWLAGPARLVPGNTMMFTGQPDAARRKEIIDYLTTQK